MNALAILGGIQAGSSLVDTYFDAIKDWTHRKFTHDENKLTREFTSQENELARQFNSKEAQLARDFSALEAQKQREFERDMSNTAVQRRMIDLQRAGVNPLIAGSSEASTPTGSMASTVSASSSSASSPMIGYSSNFRSSIGSGIQSAITAIQRDRQLSEYRDWLDKHKDVDNFLKEANLMNDFRHTELNHLAKLIDSRNNATSRKFATAVERRIKDSMGDVEKINDYIKGLFVK